MSASDQERDEQRATERKPVPAGESGDTTPESRERTEPEPEGRAKLDEPEALNESEVLDEPGESHALEDDGQDEAEPRSGLAPWQARRLRIAAASVLMVAAAVILAVRLASRSSVLVVGVYGLLLILCGIVIELSRRGRTRLGSWVLGTGLIAALMADWRLLP